MTFYLNINLNSFLPFSLLLFLFSLNLQAQKIPEESPKATLIQRIGLSDITLEYSRPNVKNRKILGGLVPYNQVWRTGANYPTFITLTDTTIIEKQQTLQPGKYALYTIPHKDSCTVIFSKNINLWGAFDYSQKDDALRVKVPLKTFEFTETFTLAFENLTDHSVLLAISWDNFKIPIQLEVDIYLRVLKHIKQQIAQSPSKWRIYWKGAKHLLKHEVHLQQAEEWIDESLKIEKNWMNLWTKAKILALKNNYQEAITSGEQALAKGIESGQYFFYKEAYQKEMEDWKRKK